jgi:2TM domain
MSATGEHSMPPNPAGTPDPDPAPNRDRNLDDARRWVRKKRIFYTVIGVYAALSLMWFTIDLLDDSDSFWFYWPMLGSGLGVAVTGIVMFGLGGLFGIDWERRQIEKYLRRRQPNGGDPRA